MKPALNPLLAMRYGIDLEFRDRLNISPEVSRRVCQLNLSQASRNSEPELITQPS